jgi:N-methylhydantoinase A
MQETHRMTTRYRIGIDVGGTFTDLVAADQDGAITLTKSSSTPTDQSIGVIQGLRQLSERLGLSLRDLLIRTERIVHGSTVATNALLERKGAKVGLLTTAGHRDILEMREGLKPERYNLRMPPPAPLVPRHLRRGVRERMSWAGEAIIPLDEASLRDEITRLKAEGVGAVAVCYLHSYRNAYHERRTAEILRADMPGVYVSLSCDVLPQIKEYERVSTTVVNAYVGPAMQRYLNNLRQRLAEEGLPEAPFIILSNGGITSIETAGRLAAATVLSGPAGGIAGTQACARLLGLGNVIPFDMGGTSTDISLVSNGEAVVTSERGLGGERIAMRSFDILSIGAGGGSIARIDAGGAFDVGPESAGAVPGPVCYGRGGVEPTVTDANLLLGYLDPEHFLGGQSRLDVPSCEASVEKLSGTLGLDKIDMAAGIFRLINVKMADGIRLMTLRRGVDPRQFTMLSFGGAAGIHATEVAREMEISRVVVPTVASVLSAWGMLASDLRYEMTRSHIANAAGFDDAGLRRIYADLEAEAMAAAEFSRDFPGRIRVERSAAMRYGEQIYEVDVSLEGLDLNTSGLTDALIERFHKRHEELYTYSSRGHEVVLVNIHLAIVGEVARATGGQAHAPAAAAATPRRTKRIYTGGCWTEAAVYGLEDLAPGHEIVGPAVIEAETTTVILHSGDRSAVTPLGWLDIAVASRQTRMESAEHEGAERRDSGPPTPDVAWTGCSAA